MADEKKGLTKAQAFDLIDRDLERLRGLEDAHQRGGKLHPHLHPLRDEVEIIRARAELIRAWASLMG